MDTQKRAAVEALPHVSQKIGALTRAPNSWKYLVRPARIELTAYRLGGDRSIHLSYERTRNRMYGFCFNMPYLQGI